MRLLSYFGRGTAEAAILDLQGGKTQAAGEVLSRKFIQFCGVTHHVSEKIQDSSAAIWSEHPAHLLPVAIWQKADSTASMESAK